MSESAVPGAAESVEQLIAAQDLTAALIAALGPDRLADPTPCEGWDVRTLVTHLIIGSRLFALLVRGEPRPDPAELDARRTDLLGDDAAAAYRAATDELIEAYRRPGAMEQPMNLPYGVLPGAATVPLRIVETMAHGWDLGRVLGRMPEYDPRTIEAGLETAHKMLAMVPPGRNAFAPPRPAPDDAAPLDRLAALMGRSLEE